MEVQPFELKLELSEDRKVLTVTFPGTAAMTVDSLVELMTLLGQGRSQMDPPIPNDPPLLQRVATIDDPRYWIGPDTMNGGALMLMRHPLLGWLAFRIPPQEVENLSRLLREHCDPGGAPPVAPN